MSILRLSLVLSYFSFSSCFLLNWFSGLYGDWWYSQPQRWTFEAGQLPAIFGLFDLQYEKESKAGFRLASISFTPVPYRPSEFIHFLLWSTQCSPFVASMYCLVFNWFSLVFIHLFSLVRYAFSTWRYLSSPIHSSYLALVFSICLNAQRFFSFLLCVDRIDAWKKETNFQELAYF